MGYKDGKGLPKPSNLFGAEPEPLPNLFTETHDPIRDAPKPSEKIGSWPQRKREPKRGQGGWQQVAAGGFDPNGQWARMWELKRRVADGEDFETVKRELWADQYRGETT
jgi:hypothetical protein